MRTSGGEGERELSRLRPLLVVTVLLLLVAWLRCGSAQPALPTPSSTTPGTSGVSAPPPADRLVFDSDRTGNFEIFSMRTDASDAAQLTRDASFDSFWGRISPDRMRILFYRTPKGVHDRDYTQASLWVMNANGSGQRELRARAADGWTLQGHAEWSPDGRQIVMAGGPSKLEIYVTDAEGRGPRQVTARGGRNIDPSWSPDGKTIVFIGCASSGDCNDDRKYEVFTVAASGGDARRLTTNDIADYDPYYSPDSRRIAWLARTDPSGLVGVWNIFVMSADGSGQRNLTNDGAVSSKPQWSRDSAVIYFHRLDPRGPLRFEIFSIRSDGTGLTSITKDAPGNNEYPSN